MSDYATGPMRATQDPRDAEIAQLRAELAAREAEVARLLALNEHRTITAEQKSASDKRLRINDLAAKYAGKLVVSYLHDGVDVWAINCVTAARALATAVVEAEE